MYYLKFERSNADTVRVYDSSIKEIVQITSTSIREAAAMFISEDEVPRIINMYETYYPGIKKELIIWLR